MMPKPLCLQVQLAPVRVCGRCVGNASIELIGHRIVVRQRSSKRSCLRAGGKVVHVGCGIVVQQSGSWSGGCSAYPQSHVGREDARDHAVNGGKVCVALRRIFGVEDNDANNAVLRLQIERSKNEWLLEEGIKYMFNHLTALKKRTSDARAAMWREAKEDFPGYEP